MAKDIFSKIIKNYNNELEAILEKKDFSEDVKNLLLSMLYKIENAYDDYKKVKVNVCSKNQFVEEVLETIEKKCKQIQIVKPMTEEGKRLYDENKNCIVDIENGIIKTFQNEKSMLDAIIEIRQKKLEIDSKYELIEEPIKNVLYIGNKTNTLELIKDFNGWSWDISSLDKNIINYNKMYQLILILLGNKKIDSWINNRKIEEIQEIPNNVILSSKYNESFGITKKEMEGEKLDNIEELINALEETYKKELSQKFIISYVKAIILECCNQDKNYKQKIKNEIENTQKELEKMQNNRTFIEELSIKKKQINIEIAQIDKLLADEKTLKEQYEKKNENLPNKDKIFSVSHLKLMLEKQRENLLEETKTINKNMQPKEFVKVKKERENKIQFFQDIKIEENTKENILRIQKKLEKAFLECFKVKIEKAQDKKEIENLIYELRYYKLMPSVETKKIEEVEQQLINKACEQKVLLKFSQDNQTNYIILKELFNTRIIDLDTIVFSLKYSKGLLTLNIYDANTHDDIKQIKITEKTELSVKLNRKLKVWQ